jgi:hypothetical protein
VGTSDDATLAPAPISCMGVTLTRRDIGGASGVIYSELRACTRKTRHHSCRRRGGNACANLEQAPARTLRLTSHKESMGRIGAPGASASCLRPSTMSRRGLVFSQRVGTAELPNLECVWHCEPRILNCITKAIEKNPRGIGSFGLIKLCSVSHVNRSY